MKILLLTLILTTQTGCAFVTSTAGSFVGNLSAKMVHEEFKSKDTAHCDPMGVQNCPKEK